MSLRGGYHGFFDDNIVVGCEQIDLCDSDCEEFSGCLECHTCDN